MAEPDITALSKFVLFGLGVSSVAIVLTFAAAQYPDYMILWRAISGLLLAGGIAFLYQWPRPACRGESA